MVKSQKVIEHKLYLQEKFVLFDRQISKKIQSKIKNIYINPFNLVKPADFAKFG